MIMRIYRIKDLEEIKEVLVSEGYGVPINGDTPYRSPSEDMTNYVLKAYGVSRIRSIPKWGYVISRSRQKYKYSPKSRLKATILQLQSTLGRFSKKKSTIEDKRSSG
ncbi:hypothetical protein Tco_0039629 [Tanacetum coccineum]